MTIHRQRKRELRAQELAHCTVVIFVVYNTPTLFATVLVVRIIATFKVKRRSVCAVCALQTVCFIDTLLLIFFPLIS